MLEVINTISYFVTACVAVFALSKWQMQLKYQRGDDLVKSAVNLRGAVNKALDHIDWCTGSEAKKILDPRIDAAFAAARDFLCCRYMAENYYTFTHNKECRSSRLINDDKELMECVIQLTHVCHKYYSQNDNSHENNVHQFKLKADEYKRDFDCMLSMVRDEVRKQRVIRQLCKL